MLLKLTYLGLVLGIIVLVFSKGFFIFLVCKNEKDLKSEKLSQPLNIVATFIIELIVIISASLYFIKSSSLL